VKLSQVAAQLYTVREHCQTAGGLATTAKKIRAIGYTAVQLSGLGPIADDEIVAIMRDAGLGICATHEPAQQILDDPGACIARLQRLGCRLAAYQFPHGIDLTNADDVRSLARRLDAAGARFRAAGLVLSYHNHALEFVKFEGAPVLDYIFAHTQPENLAAELDTYWIHHGGGDILEWIEKLRGRLRSMHLKDYGFTTSNQPTWCEIGRGMLNWTKIIAAAERSGCEWFMVEQDTCPGDPFESLAISFDYLKANLASG
jgi:sugar phosphate isomerase/epimerase